MIQTFKIATAQGPVDVQGTPFVATIGDREARLFIHTESPLEGPRISCQRSGMKIANLAPYALARFVRTGDSEAARDTMANARSCIASLCDKHGAAKLWAVMDQTPTISKMEGIQS